MLEASSPTKMWTSFAALFFPSGQQWLLAGPPALIWSFSCLALCGWLKTRRHLKTGYTRKIFHILIFLAAACIQWLGDIRLLCVFGTAVSMAVFYAVYRGEGWFGYEALAREKDAPHRTWYILAPYLATLLGGLTSVYLFGSLALVGYLVTGLGDAIGEPVGVRFGRHAYRVPAWGGVRSTRTLEGSLAVFLISIPAAFAGAWAGVDVGSCDCLVVGAVMVAAVAAMVEAISPHGWDNLTLQVIPSGLMVWWIS